MAYAIMRCEKSLPRVTWRVPFHTLTESERLNADLDRTPENEIMVRYDKEQTDNEIESARTRKDNVIIRYVHGNVARMGKGRNPFTGQRVEREKHGVAQGRVWSREYKVCCPA